ncbi:MAG: hypothetical protein GY797_20100 [Deltaproteobacteria bacterium]|nr:hypothetical protein [Deltaproteobacteria bacterium]
MPEQYVTDLLFGFAICQYAEATFQVYYKERNDRLKQFQNNQEGLELIATREFVKYWKFDVVRLIHLIVEEWSKHWKVNFRVRPGCNCFHVNSNV